MRDLWSPTLDPADPSEWAGRPHSPRLSTALRIAGSRLLELLVPRRCGVCGAFGSFLCARCAAALPRLHGSRCRTCANPLRAGGTCRACTALADQPLDELAAAFDHDLGARRLVHRLKYERLWALAEPMGALMADVIEITISADTLVVPVPLHPCRQRDRGFNQAALLARHVAQIHGLEADDRVLVRVRPTRPQVRTSGAVERAANVAGAFAAPAPLPTRPVLLVDDVATTGATLRACAAALRAAGVRSVRALVFAHGA